MTRRTLVANRLLLQPHGMFQSLGHRAWHAYYCLPRDEKGEPPSYRSLEEQDNGRGPLSNGAIQKLITGKLKKPGLDVLDKCAQALRVSVRWLQFNEGEPPTSSWMIPPYPYASSAGISTKAKAAFDSDAKKLLNSPVARRTKGARK
jgi:hypothetical protein